MISNPARFFVTGSETKMFIYEGGSDLYHFCPHDNNLSNSFENNIVFFANDEEHALDVLRRLFEFAIECKTKYILHKRNVKGAHWKDFVNESDYTIQKFTGYLDALKAKKIKVEKAPTNQVYIAGWASNDTLH